MRDRSQSKRKTAKKDAKNSANKQCSSSAKKEKQTLKKKNDYLSHCSHHQFPAKKQSDFFITTTYEPHIPVHCCSSSKKSDHEKKKRKVWELDGFIVHCVLLPNSI